MDASVEGSYVCASLESGAVKLRRWPRWTWIDGPRRGQQREPVAPGGGRARVSPLHDRLSPLVPVPRLFQPASYYHHANRFSLTAFSFSLENSKRPFHLGPRKPPEDSLSRHTSLTRLGHRSHASLRSPLAFIAYIAATSLSLSFCSLCFVSSEQRSRLTGALQSPARTSSCTYDVST